LAPAFGNLRGRLLTAALCVRAHPVRNPARYGPIVLNREVDMRSIGTKIIGAILGVGFFMVIGAGIAMADGSKGGIVDVCKVRRCM
jgi:hypothetical protein